MGWFRLLTHSKVMLVKSQNYDTIYASSHWAETMLKIGSRTITQSSIKSLSTSLALFADYFSIGNTVVNQFDAQIYGLTQADCPTLTRVEIYTRITDGTNTSDWLTKGSFYTKKPSYDPVSNVLTISGYDEMYKTEVIPFEEGVTVTTFNNPTLRQLARHIVDGTTYTVLNSNFAGCGLVLEDLSQISNTITVSAPPYGLTVREILSDIAKIECGNWMLTYVNSGTNANPSITAKLRLCKMEGQTSSAVVGQALAGAAIVGED